MYIIRKNDCVTTNWSGGTTTQLCIYPNNSSYSDKSFIWRISSAKVEVEESEFTHLPSIQRKIMVLEGTLKLRHENHHDIVLKEYEVDSFSGDWKTTSNGKVKDFNLMLNKQSDGEIQAISLNELEIKSIPVCKKSHIYDSVCDVYYVSKNKVSVRVGDDAQILCEGDLIILNDLDNEIVFENNTNNEVKMVKSTIFWNEY